MNNIYLATFSGITLPGEMLIIDGTKKDAFNKAKKEIIEMGLWDKNKEFSIDDLTLIDLNAPKVIVIDNGDY